MSVRRTETGNSMGLIPLRDAVHDLDQGNRTQAPIFVPISNSTVLSSTASASQKRGCWQCLTGIWDAFIGLLARIRKCFCSCFGSSTAEISNPRHLPNSIPKTSQTTLGPLSEASDAFSTRSHEAPTKIAVSSSSPVKKVMSSNGTVWFEPLHFQLYFFNKDYFCGDINYNLVKKPESLLERVLYNIKDVRKKQLNILGYVFFIENDHYTLVLVDRDKRTVEYYDSKVNYGDHINIVKALQRLTDDLSKQEGGKPYQFICKITKHLQKDSYQCGPWAAYFLEKRVEDPNVDFNQLDSEKVDLMIAEYRKHIAKSIE